MTKSELNENCYIIGIGASAGGMEAIHSLFDNTPEDGVAYIIIQHLSPDHKSFMAELLQKHSKLKICVAENGMYVEPNQVYLMPKGKNMTINDRVLRLSDSNARPTNTAIDIFLNSLAEDQGNKSIALILSGAGNDGTKGVEAIKRNGGMVIVQEPTSAKFNSMPLSAIETGCADAVLAPDMIPIEIIEYLNREELELNFKEEIDQNNQQQLTELLQIVAQHTNLDFSNYKRPTILRRIVNRMSTNKITTLENYIDYAKNNVPEVNLLADDFLISVTKFFRDKEAFDVLNEKVIPEIISNKLMVDTLKIWVVGCATGEEAYSIAILIMEHLTELKKNLEVKIFASDIDKSALAVASRGVYSTNIEKQVSEERLSKYFIKENDKYRVRDNIRKMIIFADHDIVRQPAYGKIDLISCRNLLIYINPILQKKILSSLHFCLNTGGYLFLGPSESLADLKSSFEILDKKWKIYKSINESRQYNDSTYSIPRLQTQTYSPNKNASNQINRNEVNFKEIDNHTILEELGYEAGIYVDSDFLILETFGNYEKYLLPKFFNFKLLEMLPEELSIATSTTLIKSSKEQKRARLSQVEFVRDQHKHIVNVEVIPVKKSEQNLPTLLLVLYSDFKKAEKVKENEEHFQLDSHSIQHITDLKDELSSTKEKLKNLYYELDLSNDNISSYNEELISSNEELQSTNEELQSVNEELQTVNNEYQLKIKELAELNDDLNNFFKGTLNGQIYIDKNLILRKYTPPAVQQINLQDSDIGRPLSDISTKIKLPTLIDNIQMVIKSSSAINKEIQTNDGRWYQMAITPYYKEHDDIHDGAIVTFNDITELKKIQEKLYRINADHNTFIYSASHDLKGPLANVEGLITYLMESQDSGKIDTGEIMKMIQISIANFTETINELSDIAKIESEIDKKEAINLKQLFEEVKISLKKDLDESEAVVTCDFKEPSISFSKKNLRSILLNLLSNALKYRAPNRTPNIKIRSVKEENFIMLSVEDNGLGMEQAKIEEIFAAFKRRHQHVEGSGVGLFLVKKIISNAEGEITVESELGRGSTFKVFFKV